jgi:hypothetical protein
VGSTDGELAVRLLRLANGYQISQAIAVAAVLGLADGIDGEPRAVGEIAAQVGADEGSLYRLLRALTTIGIFQETEERCFAATPVSELLRSDHPRSMRAWPTFVGRGYHWAAWGDLLTSVRTGGSAMEHLYGTDVWQFRADKPEETTIFNAAMSALARNAAGAIVDAYDFDRFDRVVDVGGGTGTLLIEILSRYEHPDGVVFDLPHVVAEATVEVDRAGLAHRCEVVGGSYLDGVPAGGDLYVIKSVLMDCADDDARVILRHVRQAMGDAGVVLVIESMIGAPNEGEPAAFSDLNMLVATGGRLRGRDDWRAMLTDTGFDLVDVTPTASSFSLIEGRPTARP